MLRVTITLALALLAVSGAAPLLAQTDDEPPYLYYYSRMLGGIIIERADGSDSRHIGANVIPPGATGLSGPGWSPSGRYFATYQIISYGLSGNATGNASVINVQGEPIAQWLGLIAAPQRMQWSPTGEDILLVLGNYRGDSAIGLGTFVWLIDIENNRLLADFGMNIGLTGYDMTAIMWDVPNERITFYLAPDTYDYGSYYRVTMHFDGTTLREPVTREVFDAHYTSPEMVFPDLRAARSASPSGHYEIESLRATTLTDTHTGETVELPRHSQATVCQIFVWSEDEQHIITLNGTLVSGGGCAAAVLGVTDNQGELWRELGYCSWNFPPCVDWLPERVEVAALPPGSPHPVQLDHAWIDYNIDNIMFGSPDPEVLPLRLRCGEEQLTATIIDINTEEVLYALDSVRCPYTPAHWYAEEGLAIVAAYNPTHDLIATYSRYWEAEVSIWQRRDDGYERALKLNTNGYLLEFTDDDAYLRARNVNGWKVYAVEDILAAMGPGVD
jgi:hypothetical protein